MGNAHSVYWLRFHESRRSSSQTTDSLDACAPAAKQSSECRGSARAPPRHDRRTRTSAFSASRRCVARSRTPPNHQPPRPQKRTKPRHRSINTAEQTDPQVRVPGSWLSVPNSGYWTASDSVRYLASDQSCLDTGCRMVSVNWRPVRTAPGAACRSRLSMSSAQHLSTAVTQLAEFGRHATHASTSLLSLTFTITLTNSGREHG